MRSLLLVLAACGHPAGGEVARAPRLQLPAVIDAARPDAGYLTAVALQLQPGWSQFLDDCRARLPEDHPLNRMSLETTVEITLDRKGDVQAVSIAAASGNRDFDKAVKDAVAEIHGFGTPPPDALSDDDRVYLKWLFARDRRQAGPVTARIEHRELPDAVPRFIAEHDLARAAKRALQTKDRASVDQIMIAALREGVTSVDGTVQRSAVKTIARTNAPLVADVRSLLDSSDRELKKAAIEALGRLGDVESANRLLAMFERDLAEQPAFAFVEARALVQLGKTSEVAASIAKALPNPTALVAFSIAPTPDSLGKVTAAVTHGNAITRAAACAGLDGNEMAVAAIAKGLRDADATVRSACVNAAPKSLAVVVASLQNDRDLGVRGSAIRTIARLDPTKLVRAASDPSAEIRAAYTEALYEQRRDDDVRQLIEDRDPLVRAGAWVAANKWHLRLEATPDPNAEVRKAQVWAMSEDNVRTLARSDESPEVRSVALEQLVLALAPNARMTTLLEAFMSTQPASADRVRIARAWLQAK